MRENQCAIKRLETPFKFSVYGQDFIETTLGLINTSPFLLVGIKVIFIGGGIRHSDGQRRT